MNSNFHDLAASIQCSILQLRRALLPSTMTRTNLSDAARKLDELVEVTSKAAHKTIEIAEEQKQIYDKYKADLSVEDFEKLQRFSLELIIAQETQDLTGQLLKKVALLAGKVESELENLLKELGVPVEKTETNNPVDQELTDEILNALKP